MISECEWGSAGLFTGPFSGMEWGKMLDDDRWMKFLLPSALQYGPRGFWYLCILLAVFVSSCYVSLLTPLPLRGIPVPPRVPRRSCSCKKGHRSLEDRAGLVAGRCQSFGGESFRFVQPWGDSCTTPLLLWGVETDP